MIFAYKAAKLYSQEWTDTLMGILLTKGKESKLKEGMIFLNEDGDENELKSLNDSGFGLYDAKTKEYFKPTLFPLLTAISTFNGYTLKDLRFSWTYLYGQKILFIWTEDHTDGTGKSQDNILGLIYDPYFDLDSKIKKLKSGEILEIDFSPFEESKMV